MKKKNKAWFAILGIFLALVILNYLAYNHYTSARVFAIDLMGEPPPQGTAIIPVDTSGATTPTVSGGIESSILSLPTFGLIQSKDKTEKWIGIFLITALLIFIAIIIKLIVKHYARRKYHKR